MRRGRAGRRDGQLVPGVRLRAERVPPATQAHFRRPALPARRHESDQARAGRVRELSGLFPAQTAAARPAGRPRRGLLAAPGPRSDQAAARPRPALRPAAPLQAAPAPEAGSRQDLPHRLRLHHSAREESGVFARSRGGGGAPEVDRAGSGARAQGAGHRRAEEGGAEEERPARAGHARVAPSQRRGRPGQAPGAAGPAGRGKQATRCSGAPARHRRKGSP